MREERERKSRCAERESEHVGFHLRSRRKLTRALSKWSNFHRREQHVQGKTRERTRTRGEKREMWDSYITIILHHTTFH